MPLMNYSRVTESRKSRMRLGVESLECRRLLTWGEPLLPDVDGVPTLELNVDNAADVVDGDHSIGQLSLREAVIQANAFAGNVNIHIGELDYVLEISGTHEDSAMRGDLDITNSAGVVRVLGADVPPHTASISSQHGDRAFHVRPGAQFELHGVTVQDGQVEAQNGAAVANEGALALNYVKLFNNHTTRASGGGIFNTGTLTVQYSWIQENSGTAGGGIFTNQQIVTFDTQFESNLATNDLQPSRGGAVFVSGSDDLTLAPAKFERTNFQSGSADFGGAIYAESGRVDVIDAKLRYNTSAESGGAIATEDTFRLTIEDSQLSDNQAGDQGGAIYLANSVGAIVGSTMERNSASVGGALSTSDSSIQVSQTDFELNTATWKGGSVALDGDDSIDDGRTLDIRFFETTFVRNSAGQTGGALSMARTTATIEQSDFVGNETTWNGGAIESSGTLWVSKSDFRGNLARDGGGIDSSGDLNVADSTFVVNHARNGGGGISIAQGALVVTDSEFRRNRADRGGGVAVPYNGDVTISDSLFHRNAADQGGGMHVEDSAFLLKDTTVTRNEAGNGAGIYLGRTPDKDARMVRVLVTDNVSERNGGGVYAKLSDSGDLKIEDSTLSRNHAQSGAGIYTESYDSSDGVLSILRTTVDNNRATGGGGGLSSRLSSAVITDSTIDSNVAAFGGGIYQMPTTGDVRLVLNRSTVSRNSAYFGAGGGIYARVGNELVLNGSTVSRNTAIDRGSAVYVQGSVQLRHSTITANTVSNTTDALGGAVFVGSNLDATHTIIAGNTNESQSAFRQPIPDDLVGVANAQLSLDFSLVGTSTGSAVEALSQGIGNVINNDPGLGPLANYGGPTETHVPRIGSPALDAGQPNLASEPASPEQRGRERFVGVIDIGSVEANTDDLVGDTAVAGVVRNQGNGNYDQLTSLGFEFSHSVDISQIDIAALSIRRAAASSAPMSGSSVTVDYDYAANSVTWDLASLGLSPGRYTASIDLSNAGHDAYETEILVTLSGDANLDGIVDISDFNVWQANRFTTNATWQTGDFDGNATVDANDFAYWSKNLFTSIGQSTSQEAAPLTSGVRQSPRTLGRRTARIPQAALVDRALSDFAEQDQSSLTRRRFAAQMRRLPSHTESPSRDS